jgi:hypothetical protein
MWFKVRSNLRGRRGPTLGMSGGRTKAGSGGDDAALRVREREREREERRKREERGEKRLMPV